VAIERGLLDACFEPQGIHVRSLNSSAQRSVRDAHYDHSQQYMFRQGGSMPPLWSRSRGADTVLLATSWIREYQAVIAMPGSGITGPADLRGRRLGLPRRLNDPFDYWRAMCLRGYEAALGMAGLGLDEVEWVDLPVQETQIPDGGASKRGTLWRGAARARRQSREALALIRGEVDAIYTASAPGAQLTAFMGAQVVADISLQPSLAMQSNNQLPILLTVDRALLRDRPAAVVDYISCLLDAAAWAATHGAEAQAIIGGDVAATAEWVTAANGDDIHQQLRPVFDPAHLEAIDSLKRFMLRQGLIENDFEIAQWADPEPLRLAIERRADGAG